MSSPIASWARRKAVPVVKAGFRLPTRSKEAALRA